MEQQLRDVIKHQKEINNNYVEKIINDDMIITLQDLKDENNYGIVIHFDNDNEEQSENNVDDGQTYIVVADINEIGDYIENVHEMVKNKILEIIQDELPKVLEIKEEPFIKEEIQNEMTESQYEVFEDAEIINCSEIKNENEIINIKINENEYIVIDDLMHTIENFQDIGGTIEIHSADNNLESISELGIVQLVDLNNLVTHKSAPLAKAKTIKTKPLMRDRSDRKDYSKFERIHNVKIVRLTTEQQIEEFLEKKNSVNYRECKFKCHVCYKGFATQTSFDYHIARHDPDFGVAQCHICQLRLINRSMHHQHLVRHEVRYHCNACGHIAKDWQLAQRHSEAHHDGPYGCSQCALEFQLRASYYDHMYSNHDSGEASCCVCLETFASALEMEEHRKTVHRNVKIENERDREVLLAASSIQVDQSDMNVEQTIVVMSENEARAEEFIKVPNELIIANEFTNDACKKREPVSLVCENCGYFSANAKEARVHKKSHTERVFKCSRCEKTCPTKLLLKYHSYTHTGERPYQCPICSKCFYSHPALFRHKRVHTGEKPFECNICGNRFTQSNGLHLHIRTVHMKIPYISKKKAKKLSQALAAAQTQELE